VSRASRWAAVVIVLLGAGACQIIAGIDDRELVQPHPGVGGFGGSSTPGAGGAVTMAGSSGTGGVGGSVDLEGGPDAGASDAPDEVAPADATSEMVSDAEVEASDGMVPVDGADASDDQGPDAAVATDAPGSDASDAGITTNAADAFDSSDASPQVDDAAEASPTDGGSDAAAGG